MRTVFGITTIILRDPGMRNSVQPFCSFKLSCYCGRVYSEYLLKRVAHRKFSVARDYKINLRMLDCTILISALLNSAHSNHVAHYCKFSLARD